ncbi:MAG: polyribonucleotide nucleotidyltransferase [Synergistaceae bacterium]|nr:polyribonucleotide nucleotidyltransferase [Synergistaceae bacterium]MBP9957644.1 polyribonucleotide nucleotidyltransferase [Synergistaceae bacterium]
MKEIFKLELAGKTIQFETGRMAKQAHGSVVAQVGDTMALITAVVSENPREGLDFFPLLVDYEERFYSAGKIPGGFIKRESRPSETAILSARMMDRSIRSLFDDNMRNDVHVVATVLSVDQRNTPGVLAINGASAALALSDIPWNGPIGAVRVGCIDNELVINPTEDQMSSSTLDLVVAGHAGGITMVEAGAHEVPESLLIDALELAQKHILTLVDFFNQMRESSGKKKRTIPTPARIKEIDDWIEAELWNDVYAAIQIHEKQERAAALSAASAKAQERFLETHPNSKRYIADVVENLVKKGVRKLIIDDERRADGRKMNQLRQITCEIDVLTRTHGSALFTRGETQSLAVTTLGMVGTDDQMLDGLKWDEPSKRFILHYNFPPYSVGEVRPMRGPGRREIGHGALAERALRAVFPTQEEFPYVVRIVSDILESNGSSSMASVCGGSLSMMDAGVPIKRPVAGVAMGLIAQDGKIAVLTDIQGLEDHYGDMDFKVTGTREGVTALQMDNKAGGITRAILEQALGQAREGRLEILDHMDKAIAEPRKDISQNAPRILTLQVDPDKIRDIIGPGGKMIRSIVQQTGAKIDVEDSGKVYISAMENESAEAAATIIRDLTRVVQAGETFIGKVTRIIGFGVFVEVLPGREGLLHVSEFSTHRIGKVEDAFSVGDAVIVTVKEIDDMNRVNLSRRRILDKLDELAKDPVFTAQVLLERTREERFATLKSEDSGAPRHDRPSGDRPRGPRPDRR